MWKKKKKKTKKKKNRKHSLQQPENKREKKMADLKKFTTTLIQLHFSSHKNRFFPERK